MSVIKHKTLIHGFVREMESNLRSYYTIHDGNINYIIPLELIRMIISFFPSYQIYGIGWNNKGQLGLNHTNRLIEYKELLSFASVCTDAKNISIGNKRFMVQNANNEVYCAGFNHRGQLGIGIISDYQTTFTPMVATIDDKTSIQEVAFISNGIASNHTFIKSLIDNKIYGFGTNMDSQLGFKRKDKKNEPSPVHISDMLFNNKNIINIECGLSHTLFLSSDGCVFSAGSNLYGQCGFLNQTCIKTSLVEFDNKSKIVSIHCGSNFSIFMNDCHQLYSCGNDEYGQLGLSFSNDVTGIRFNGLQLIPYFKDGEINISKISCGYGFTGCIDNKGKCYVWGCNYSNQLGGLGGIVNSVYILEMESLIDISCGSEHTLFLSKSNNVYICGQNYGINSSELVYKTPTIIRKKQIGVNDDMPITKIIAGVDSSLIILQWTNQIGKM